MAPQNQAPGPSGQAARPAGRALALPLAAAALVAAAGGVLAVAYLGGAHGGRDDVGDLQGLRPVQERLRPLAACRIEYNTHIRQRDGKVRLYPCTDRDYPTPVILPVPDGWPYRQISFSADRSSPERRWAIWVDRDRVPFPALVAALEGLAPMLAAEHPAAAAAVEARERTAREQLDAQEEERRRGAERSKATYPPR